MSMCMAHVTEGTALVVLLGAMSCQPQAEQAAQSSSAVASSSTSGGGGGSKGFVYRQPDPSVCDATRELEHGYLCAIRPSRLDDTARDVFGEATVADKNFGFGYHVVAFPTEATAIEGVYLHFTGSMGRAYHQGSQRFPSQTLLKEAMKAGYITVQVAYHNRYAVNSPEECIGAKDIDDCAGRVRYEKITGEDVTSVVEVPPADSIRKRLLDLFGYMQNVGFDFPAPVTSNGEIAWENLRLGGHSQGSGHALYITKYWNSQHTCLLGGPYDVPDTVPSLPPENIADWYLDDSRAIDRSKLRALVAVDDANYSQFVAAYAVLGLEEGLHWQSFSAASYTDWEGKSISGHGAVVHDPAFAEQRFRTCFAPFGD
jgi:hypothetical protein